MNASQYFDDFVKPLRAAEDVAYMFYMVNKMTDMDDHYEEYEIAYRNIKKAREAVQAAWYEIRHNT